MLSKQPIVKEPKKRVPKSAEQALSALMRLCARSERSSGDALRLMQGWQVAAAERAGVLAKLQHEGFINDERYAEAFVREKLSLSAWGEYKIRAALQRKGIERAIIDRALNQMDRGRSEERLQTKLQSKVRTIKYDNAYQLKTKLMRYALSLGYPIEVARDAVESILKNINIEQECEEQFYF